MGSLAPHKFVKLTEVNTDFAELPKKYTSNEPFNYMLEVYVDNYIVLDIPRSQDQLHHVANAIMTGVHCVLPYTKIIRKMQSPSRKFLKRKPHGQLLRMCWYLNLI